MKRGPFNCGGLLLSVPLILIETGIIAVTLAADLLV
jgi:hypothetical protein